MDLVFVGDRCNDHSPSGGYDQLCSLFPAASWLSGRALEAGRLEWHRSPTAPATAPRIFHVIYGDCSGKALPELLRKQFSNSMIVSSAHRPVTRIADDSVACGALRTSDAIVAVSEVQARELRVFGFSQPIYSIPHGVWTQAFRPAGVGRRVYDVLLVGSFLRDWDGAKKVVQHLAGLGVRSVALGAGPRDRMVGEPPQFEVLQRIPEPELALLYKNSAAVFLPFLDATASNALLEAMAAGCPVICSRLPSLLEYLSDDSDTFEPGQYDRAAERILHYVRNPIDRDARAQKLRAHSEQYDWSRLRSRFAAAYAEVAIASANATLVPVALDNITLEKIRPNNFAQKTIWKCGSS